MKTDKKKTIRLSKKCLIAIIALLLYTHSYSETLKIARVEGNSEQLVASMILEAVYQRLEIPVEFVELPGQRALELSSKGMVDGEVIRIYELESMYPSLIRVPTPYYYPETVVFTKNHNFEVSGWSSLQDYRVGIARGMKYYEIKLEGAKHLEKVNDVNVLMRMLDLDRIDIVVETLANGMIQVEKMGLDSIKALSPPLERLPLYHYLHEKHKDLVPRVNEIIKDMAESGELELLKENFMDELLE